MKHPFWPTMILLLTFVIAQYLGLLIVYNYIDFEESVPGEMEFKSLPIGERPEIDEEVSYIYVFAAIIIGTVIALFLARFTLIWIWKIWFLLAITMTLGVAFSAFSFVPAAVALGLAMALGIWRTFWPNWLVQMGTELFVYGGLAAIFVPWFNLWSISILLVLIAAYDAYAVWKSKHMITLAKSQSEAKIFAGLTVPYIKDKLRLKGTKKRTVGEKTEKEKKVNKTEIPIKARVALLGGGDVGFPLLFAGVVLKEFGLWQSLVIPIFAMVPLALLFWKAEKDKFYPAMPFIGAGCLIGLLVVWLIGLI
jgi:presenilin-like A22 family membrane protease